MSMINSQDATPPIHNPNDQVGPVKAKGKADFQTAKEFLGHMQGDKDIKGEATLMKEETITPEELQRQVRQSIFRSGFNKSIEKARDIANEIKK